TAYRSARSALPRSECLRSFVRGVPDRGTFSLLMSEEPKRPAGPGPVVIQPAGREALWRWLGRDQGGNVTSQVILEDGSESPLSDHWREVHRKGTRGLTDEYLANLHQTLHEPKRDPHPEHDHPGEGLPEADEGLAETADDMPAIA